MNKTALVNVRLVSLKEGTYKNVNIIINQKGFIESIDSNELIDETYNRIDGNDCYVLPGLINAHAHLFSSGKPHNFNASPKILNKIYWLAQTTLGKKILRKIMRKNAKIELDSGVTTIRSVGEFFYQDVKLRDELKEVRGSGPNLLVSGFFLSVTDGHGAPYLALESDSPWEARKSVRKNAKQDVDWIKICVTGGVTDAKRIGEAGALQFTLEEVEAICDEAHKNGTMVSAHVESSEGVRIALKAGVDTIEHGAELDEEMIHLFKYNPKSLRGYSALIPTFSAAIPSEFFSQSELNQKDVTIINGKMVYQEMVTCFQQAIEHDLMIGVGNDASMPYVTHYDFWREIMYFVKLGKISPIKAIEMATKKNAEILGLGHLYGTVEVGKVADLILLKENPAENIRDLEHVDKVIKAGILIDKKPIKKDEHLETLLNQI
ncbi:MAG: amidohydrolase family protein [Vagococcus sp.]|uniref:metal-dependent hydrolase family protein n=1 Tax=Vagococcus TaxID=2737 RepID=UPI002FCA6A8F